jgi:hypothetical protein
MLKSTFTEIYNYGKSDMNCLGCLHSTEVISKGYYQDKKYECEKMKERDAGALTKATYYCDLWETKKEFD